VIERAVPPASPVRDAIRRRMAIAWAAAIVFGAGACALASHAAATLPGPAPFEELAYYPSGQALQPATLGHAETAADLAWLRAVQYYGEHRVTDLFEGSAAVVAMYGRVRQDYFRQLTHFDDRYVVFHTGIEPLTFESTVTLRTVHRYEMELLLGAAGMRARAITGAQEALDGGEGHEMLIVAERLP